MNVKNIIVEYLKANSLDGLVSPGCECACALPDLFPCGSIQDGCEVGTKQPCDGTCEDGHCDFHIASVGRPSPIADAANWVCDCGKVCEPMSSEWRWNGRDWEHHHGYPIGHVAAQRNTKGIKDERRKQ